MSEPKTEAERLAWLAAMTDAQNSSARSWLDSSVVPATEIDGEDTRAASPALRESWHALAKAMREHADALHRRAHEITKDIEDAERHARSLS